MRFEKKKVGARAQSASVKALPIAKGPVESLASSWSSRRFSSASFSAMSFWSLSFALACGKSAPTTSPRRRPPAGT
jgi:hypothetical protein